MKKIGIAIAVIAIAGLGGFWWYRHTQQSAEPEYRFGAVERGNVRATVASTGTLGALRTVAVGTQVSGQIAQIVVDFNDKVRKGQLIARIDSIPQQQAVMDAEAGVQRADAQLAQAQVEFDRASALRAAQAVTDQEMTTAQTNFAVAKASAASARVSLDKARQNLAYTKIYAPIDGVIVERNVDVGQTVAASLSAPQLFLIANDLSRMQILASVDEADIGAIKEGQRVTFSVQAYQARIFNGSVRQVRLNATTQNNVVNYTAVIDVRNADGALLPGMTATVAFITGAADSVLTVPNAALRFRPAAAAVAQPGRGAAAAGDMADEVPTGTIWTLGADGKPAMLRVRTGLSDGSRMQVDGPGLREGLRVIIGTGQASAAAGTQGTTNPFQQQQPGGRRGPPGPF